MELRKLVAVIWQRLWLIVLATALVTGFSYVFSTTATRIYQAATTIEVNYGADPRSDAYSSVLVGQKAAQTYVEEVRSPQLARDVATALGLNMSPATLLNMVSVEQVRDTQLIKLTVESSNPEMAQAIANKMAELFIAQTEAKQQERFQGSKQDLDTQVSGLEKQIGDTQKAIAGLGDPSDPKNANMPEFARVERARLETMLSNYQIRYAILLTSVEDFRLAATRSEDKLSIFSQAETPRTPVRPVMTVNLALGFVSGLILGLAMALLLEYLDDTAKDPQEITSGLGLTMLGVVTRFASSKEARSALVTVSDGKSPSAEAYRVLRTNFQFSALSNPRVAAVITSPGPGEGKTTTLANLGVALAQSHKRVVLVDADLRRPSLQKLFGLSREFGLTDLMLDSNLAVERALLQTETEGLKLLPSGPLPPNPAEILSLPRMAEIMNHLKEQADVVLFDSPPVLSVADGALLAALTGNVILVVAAGETRTGAVAQARDALLRSNTSILGVVLNKLDVERHGYYRYYYYRYYGNDGAKHKVRKSRRAEKANPA